MTHRYLELIPDEILLEIFDYLSGCDTIASFYNLNQRFNSIIHGIRLYLDLSYVQQKTFLYICHYILPNFQRQISSIKLSNKQTIDGINYYLEQSTCFRQEQVKILILIEPTLEQLIKLINFFPSLRTLIIKATDYLIIPIEYIPQSLRICRIFNCQINFLSSNISEQSLFIEELNIKMSDINDLFILLHSMSYLKRLTCHISDNSLINEIDLSSQKMLLLLNYLKLNICSISFKHIENLLDLCPNLNSFIYTYTTGTNSTYDSEHIDYERWNNLFTNKIIYLKNFDLHISLNIDEQRDVIGLTKKFQEIKFLISNHIRIIYEITSYKHILCTIPFVKSHLNNHTNNCSLTTIPNAYSRIRHLDLVLNETILNRQQHSIRCPLVHSFYLGLYQTMTPIEQQSRLLLNQSISFVYLKHFELYGTCITDGFVAQLLTQMTNLNSLTLPLNYLISCQMNDTIQQNMKRIKKLQIALTESLSIDCVENVLIPIFSNLHSIMFAIDNQIQSVEQILFTMIGQNNHTNCLKYLMFIEVFALDQDWIPSMLVQLEKIIRFRNNNRILYVWL